MLAAGASSPRPLPGAVGGRFVWFWRAATAAAMLASTAAPAGPVGGGVRHTGFPANAAATTAADGALASSVVPERLRPGIVSVGVDKTRELGAEGAGVSSRVPTVRGATPPGVEGGSRARRARSKARCSAADRVSRVGSDDDMPVVLDEPAAAASASSASLAACAAARAASAASAASRRDCSFALATMASTSAVNFGRVPALCRGDDVAGVAVVVVVAAVVGPPEDKPARRRLSSLALTSARCRAALAASALALALALALEAATAFAFATARARIS